MIKGRIDLLVVLFYCLLSVCVAPGAADVSVSGSVGVRVPHQMCTINCMHIVIRNLPRGVV